MRGLHSSWARAPTLSLALVISFGLLVMVWNHRHSSVSTTPTTSTPPPPPLKVFILAGQSNMEGHGYMDRRNKRTGKYLNGTLEWLVDSHPDQYGKLKTTPNGRWTERHDVWIAYNRQLDSVRSEMNQYGPLTAGYGGDPPDQGHQMGPELGFGWTLGDALKQHDEQPILLIKVAWGGRSLGVNFRPPSSGGDTGVYYESIISHSFKTLDRLPELFPDYASIGRYQLAGFAWLQGWNDGDSDDMTNEYEFNLANLIRDIRSDLEAPNLPVVIGVSGMMGFGDTHPTRMAIIDAQFAVADPQKYPEFAGTVATVETRPFLRPPFPRGSPGVENYHWNNNCESYWLIGQAMGEAMVKLLSDKNATVEEPNI